MKKNFFDFIHKETSFKEARRFNEVLFTNAANSIENIAKTKKRSITSRLINIFINYYGQHILNRKYSRQLKIFSKIKLLSPSSQKDFTSQLQSVEVVSFDIFDTLLIRKILNPTDIFKIMESELCIDGFFEARTFAETRARETTRKADVSLAEIYDYIPDRYRSLSHLEKDFEQRFLIRNPEIYNFYLEAVKSKKRIVAISDMYLDSAFLTKILNLQGYDKIERVIVSNEENATKWNGDLFYKATKILGITPNQLLHIGDNLQSDYKKIKALSGASYWAPRINLQIEGARKKYSSIDDDLSSSIHNSLVCRYNNQSDIWHEYGYMLGGPIVISFLYWIKQHSLLDHNDHIAFIGRDGWILKKMYDKYFCEENLSSSYVYLSREISLLSTLHHNGSPEYIKYILNRAQSEGIPVPVTNSLSENLNIFDKNYQKLYAWAKTRRQELELHLKERIGTANQPAFIDLTCMWLSSLSAGNEIMGLKNKNNYALWFLGNLRKVKVQKLPFEAAINNTKEINIEYRNSHLSKNINIVNILESIISSPENRIVGLKQGHPIFGTEGNKSYYHSVEKGIDDYLNNFFCDFNPNTTNTLSITNAIKLYKQFAFHMDDTDLNTINSAKHSSHIDNITQ